MALEGLDCSPPPPTHRLTRRQVQVPHSGMWWEGTRENRFKQKRFRLNITKKLFHNEDSQAVEQTALRGYTISHSGGFHSATG